MLQKKYILVFAAVVIFSLLTVFGAQATPAQSVEEVAYIEAASDELPTIVWMIWGGADRKDAQLAQFREYFPETVDQYNIRVISPGSHGADVYQAIRLSVAAGFGVPDVVSFNYAAVPEFAAAGLLTDISGKMADYEDDMVEGAKILGQYDGKYYAIANEVKHKIWFYRTDLFAEADIDPAEIKTFDDFIAAGKKFREVHPDKYFVNQGAQPIHYMYGGLLSNWDDANMADADGNYRLTESPHFATMLENLKAIQDADIAYPADDWSSDWGPAFADDTVASWTNFQWGLLHLPSRGLPEQQGKWGLAHWPEFSRYGSDAGGSVVVFPVGAENTDLAFDFMAKNSLDPGFQLYRWEQDGRIPSSKSAFEEALAGLDDYARPDGTSDEDWNRNLVNFYGPDFLQFSLDAMDTTFKVYPFDPAFSAELSILRSWTERYLAGEVGLEEALAGAQGDMELTIGNPWEQ